MNRDAFQTFFFFKTGMAPHLDLFSLKTTLGFCQPKTTYTQRHFKLNQMILISKSKVYNYNYMIESKNEYTLVWRTSVQSGDASFNEN